MGIPTLLSTSTASNASSVAITSNITSTYDEYMFVFTDINPATDEADFTFQGSIDGGSNYNVAITSTFVWVHHTEGGTDAGVFYTGGSDLAQGTGYQIISDNIGNASDESGSGILQLFDPSDTTSIKHFIGRQNGYHGSNYSQNSMVQGYLNTTSAINAVSFKFTSGNFDGVIQMYGIS
jgi:hypothetical protein